MSDSEEDNNIAFAKNQHGTAEQSIEAGTEYGYDLHLYDYVASTFLALMEKPLMSTPLLVTQTEILFPDVESVDIPVT